MSAETLVYETPDEVRDRLALINDLTVEDLYHAIRFGYLARLTCTANDPTSLPGLLFWGRTTRGLRERLVPAGWTRRDAKLSMVVSPDGSTAIVVSTGNDDTGIADAEPKSRFSKGPATRQVVALNFQFELFPVAIVEKQPPITWVLLVSVDAVDDKTIISAELSRPAAMDEDGRIGAWFERILLPPIEDTDNSRRAPQDGELGPDIDVDVQRRAG